MISLSAVRDAAGEPLYFVTHVQDLTSRKLVEEALHESEDRFRTLAGAAPIGIYQLDAEGRCVYVNEHWTALTGLTQEQSRGRGWLQAIHPDDRDAALATWSEAERAGHDLVLDTRLRTPDGAVRFVHVRGAAVYDDAGARVALIGSVEDATESTLAEAELRRREQEFKALVENTPDIIIRYGRDARISYANPAAERMAAAQPGGLAGKEILAISRTDERARFWMERIARVRESRASLEFEYDALEEGVRRWRHARLVPEFDVAGEVASVLLVSYDITERVRSETALRESEERFRAATEGSMDAFHILRAIRDDAGAVVDFTFVEMNAHAEAFLQIRRSDSIGRPVVELFPSYYETGIFDTYKGVLESGQSLEEEFLDRTPGFENTWIRHQIVPLADGIAITARDITEERRAEEAVRESEERFRAAAKGSMDAFYILQAIRDERGTIVDFTFVEMNARAEEFLQVERDEVIGRPVSESFPDYQRIGFFSKYAGVVESGLPFEEELHDMTPGFEGAWMRHQIVPLADGVAVTSRDITEHMKFEQALKESEERFRSSFVNAVIGMARIAPDGRFLEVNPAFSTAFGYSDDELSRRGLPELAHPDDRGALVEQINRLVSGDRQAIQLEGRFYNRRAHLLWTLLGASAIRDRDGATLYLICQIQDITARKELEQRLQRQAHHDALTSLPNRVLFMDRLERALVEADRHGESIAVMYLDLDGFKSVNDTLGHSVGDQLLGEVGNRLSRCIRGGDTVARLGGDEFAIIVEGIVDPDVATRVAGRVVEEFTRPFRLGTATANVGVSIGIVYSTSGVSEPAQLIHCADVALYQAKAAGKGRYVVYGSELSAEQEDQLLAERATNWDGLPLRSERGE
jgi:diguanylate cyclase (GGDEF)-like protein/PAS domain S-box-containing protein